MIVKPSSGGRFRQVMLRYGDQVPELLGPHLLNARQVWEAWRDERTIPPLELDSGKKWFHRPSDPVVHMFFEIFAAQSYLSGDFFRPCPLSRVIDCGANIGLFTLFLVERSPGIHVHCFEPAPATANQLRLNVSNNRLDSFVEVHQFALGVQRTTRILEEHASSGQRTLLPDGSPPRGASDIVQCIDLNHALALCGDSNVDLLKIDVEGSEVEILQNGDESVWTRIQRVVLEYHDDLRPGTKDRLLNLLRTAGYDDIRLITTFPHSHTTGILQAKRGAAYDDR